MTMEAINTVLFASSRIVPKYSYDVGFVGPMAFALNTLPNLAPVMTHIALSHPDQDFIQQDPELMITVATLRLVADMSLAQC